MPSSDFTLGENGIPWVSIITSISSTKSKTLFVLVITISFDRSLPKNAKSLSISLVVLKCWDGISLMSFLANGCLPPPGTFWLTIISRYILSSLLKWWTSPVATIIFPASFVALTTFFMWFLSSSSFLKSPNCIKWL